MHTYVIDHNEAIASTIKSVSRFATYEFLGGEVLADTTALTVALKINAKMREINNGRWVATRTDTYRTYRGY